jgi:hypothetical protein
MQYRKVRSFTDFAQYSALGKAKMRISPAIEITLSTEGGGSSLMRNDPSYHDFSVKVCPIVVPKQVADAIPAVPIECPDSSSHWREPTAKRQQIHEY